MSLLGPGGFDALTNLTKENGMPESLTWRRHGGTMTPTLRVLAGTTALALCQIVAWPCATVAALGSATPQEGDNR